MAHTSEQRDTMKLCEATKQNGESCRAFAGQGTEHPGVGRCKFHLGNTKSHKTNAVLVEAQARMVKLGMPIEVHPHEALLQVLYLASGHVAWLKAEIGALEDLGTFEARVMTQLYGEERDRVAKVAKAALDAGVAERQVALVEQYSRQLADLLQAIFDDPELALAATQRERLPGVVRRHIGMIDARPGLAA
jgi:hypothetical protein